MADHKHIIQINQNQLANKVAEINVPNETEVGKKSLRKTLRNNTRNEVKRNLSQAIPKTTKD